MMIKNLIKHYKQIKCVTLLYNYANENSYKKSRNTNSINKK